MDTQLAPVSVLLVDDRPENLLALEASLEPLGQRLVKAQSGNDALRAVLEEQFAVILMDIRMPGLDGFETIGLLRQRAQSRHTPIIFLSAYAEQHHMFRSYSAGAVDYILKPFDPEALRSKVSVFVSLRQKELALQQAHDELEARVAARTAELAQTNASLASEIAERKIAQQQLFDLAHHDSLTGLPNRALFMEHLNGAVARSRRRNSPGFAVMMLDLDRFKLINDTLGHLAGDQLLVGVSRRLQHCLREVDTPARFGGDEFAMLIDGIYGVRDATRTAERIQNALKEPVDIDGKDVMISASVGIAMMNPRYARSIDLLRDADIALYRAKEEGRARYQVFDQEMHGTVSAQLRLESDLSHAIERDELVLHYQPILALGPTKTVGFEALVRWRHPERGIIAPGEFIPIAEDSGMIVSIGRWVTERACQQLAEWDRAGLIGLTMSINLSVRQLVQPELTAEIEQAARDVGVDLRRLTVEITETAMMPNDPAVQETLTHLRTLGVSISLDDFGTGYSCLSYLHDFPVTALKIDRSFVSRIGMTSERPEIVRAIVALAHNLGIDVIAEGVETPEQIERLRALECEYVQGFYYSEPLDADQATVFLRRGQISASPTSPASSMSR
ncbi:hypothetical protein BH11MYX3_BH11MYX3_32580 [soil metagenome]